MTIRYRALVLTGIGGPLEVQERELRALQAGEAAIRIRAAALNHRDLWIYKGQYAGLKFPVIMGSDGAGIVEIVGSKADAEWIGRQVVVNPSLDWGNSLEVQGKDFRILGLPDAGTFSEYVIVPVSNLVATPNGLTLEEAAALPLAGLTAYRALFTRAKIKAGEKLLITGIGGGVALALLRFAVAAKVRVFVTSGSKQKLDRAISLGAEGGAVYREEGWAEVLAEQAVAFDCIVDSAGGAGFTHLCDLARPGGRLVFFGATVGNPTELVLRKIFWKQLNLLGTTMGSSEEFSAMIRMVEDQKIIPVIDQVFHFEQAAAALDRMDESGQFGKLILSFN